MKRKVGTKSIYLCVSSHQGWLDFLALPRFVILFYFLLFLFLVNNMCGRFAFAIVSICDSV